jgi:hypothetical protein
MPDWQRSNTREQGHEHDDHSPHGAEWMYQHRDCSRLRLATSRQERPLWNLRFLALPQSWQAVPGAQPPAHKFVPAMCNTLVSPALGGCFSHCVLSSPRFN